MNFTLYGSQLAKDKSKVPSYRNSSESDLSIKSKHKIHSSNPANNSKLTSSNLHLYGTPLPSARKHEDRNSVFINKDIDSDRTRSTETSRSRKVDSLNKNKSSSNTNKPRKENLETFLNLQNISNDFNDKEFVEKWVKEQEIKDWEEISISSHKNELKRDTVSKDSYILTINRNAFGSFVYSQNFTEDNESTWNASDTIMSPMSNVEEQLLHNFPQEKAKEYCVSEEKRTKSARIIQLWYRRHLRRRKLAQAALGRMLSNKQVELKKQQSAVEQIEVVRKSLSSGRTSVSQSKFPKTSVQSIKGDSKAIKKNNFDKVVSDREVEKLVLENKIQSRPNSSRSLSSRSKGSNGNQLTNKSTKSKIASNNLNETKSHLNKSDEKGEEMDIDVSSEMSNKKVKESRKQDFDTKSTSRLSEMTTIDDILSTIKELESVDCLTDRSSRIEKRSNLHNKSGWSAITEDIDKLLKPESFKSVSNSHADPANDKRQLTCDSLEMHNNATNINTVSDSKMNSIMQFLSSSEIADNISDLENKQTNVFPVRKWNIFDTIQLEENTQTAVNEVSTKVMTMKLELEEKQRSIEMLQKALQQQRELTVRQVKETQKDMEKRMDCQKEEYETSLERNHTFIDQLISKNEILQDKCNKLVVEIKEKSQKYEERIKSLTENNSIELKKVEAKHSAAEKFRREKWEVEKTKMIKEMTIKGMESEIAQLIANHKQEVRKLKQYYENEITSAGENCYEKYNRQIDELRKQLYKEKEEACQKEHDTIKERFDDEMKRQIQILESQRKQLYEEISDERNRLNLMGNKQKLEIENLRKQLEYKEDKVGESLKLEYKQSTEEMQRRHELEIKGLTSQIELDRQIWIETQNKKNEALLLSREQEIKNEMKISRDQEIEKVIQRLEEDCTLSKEEMETVFNNKLKRNKDKYETEINELELSEKQAKEKYNQMRAEYLEIEGEHESLKVMIRQKEKEIDELRQMYETLHRERDHVSDIIRQEFADRLVTTEEENRKLKRDISELKAKITVLQNNHQADMDRVQLNHQNDMSEVHNKVKEAIKRKEENMNDLKVQFQNETQQWQEKLTAAEKRSNHLESLLEQQRKNLLKLK